MKIIIVGLGRTGLSLIKNLAEENHNIIGVDIDAACVQTAIEKFDVNGIVGNGCLAPILQEAGAENADMLIASTDKDELNLLCCLVGKSLGADRLVAQIRSPEYYSNFETMGERLGINLFVNLENTLADKITRVLRAPAEVNLSPFGRGKLEIAEFTIPEKGRVCGKTLSEIRNNHKKEFLVITVERGEEVIVPNGNTQIASGDIITVCTKHQNLRDVLGYFGIEKHRIQSVILLGCHEGVDYLAEKLLDIGMKVKVIGNIRERCERLKLRHSALTVICDDYNNKEVLLREGIEETDALVAMTSSDESNIVASLYARTYDVPKVVTIVNSDSYREMLEDISLNLTLSPYQLAGSAVATHIRSINVPKGSQIISMHKIAGGRAEALQFNVGKHTAFVGKKVSELGKKIKSGILMCAIIRKRMPIIPNGETVLEEEDNIVVASLQKRIEKLEDILK